MPSDSLGAGRAKRYQRVRLIISLVEAVVFILFLFLLLATGLSAAVEEWVQGFVSWDYAVLIGFAAVAGAMQMVLTFPFGFASGYLVEHRYGLSNQTLAAWAWERTKGLLITIPITLPLLMLFFWILRRTGEWWWVPMGVVMFLFGTVLARVAPTIIFPLFYKFEPVDESSLAARLKELGARAVRKRRWGLLPGASGFDISGVYRFNLSKNTKKANAAFAGLGKSRRLLLADTLLDEFEPPEIEGVVAHELGHYVHGHIGRGLLAGAVTTFAGFYAASLLYTAAMPQFGFDEPARIAALPLLALFLVLYGIVTSPISSGISRSFERAADRYAVELTGNAQAFGSALERLAEMNLADREPHPLVEFFFYSHPSISKRVAAVESIGRDA